MGFYESDHPDVPGMRGLHLFHLALSNGSQRVRLALEEKGLAWQSHHLDLSGNAHPTSRYGRPNPNKVVPTLVHDGQVVIESDDILAYLEAAFPEPSLRPMGAAGRARMQSLIDRASGFQGAFKVISHDRLYSRLSQDQLRRARALRSGRRSRARRVHVRRRRGGRGLAASRRGGRGRADRETLDALENALCEASWLSGEA